MYSSPPHPLKPNLIELGRYRKIDRESVTWLRGEFGLRAWQDSQRGKETKWILKVNSRRARRWFDSCGYLFWVKDTTSLLLHFLPRHWMITASCVHSTQPDLWGRKQSACFKGNNSRMKLLVLQMSNDFNCRSWNYVIAGNYMTALLSWLCCRSFPMIQLIFNPLDIKCRHTSDMLVHRICFGWVLS